MVKYASNHRNSIDKVHEINRVISHGIKKITLVTRQRLLKITTSCDYKFTIDEIVCSWIVSEITLYYNSVDRSNSRPAKNNIQIMRMIVDYKKRSSGSLFFDLKV